jgi:hypothetical protein
MPKMELPILVNQSLMRNQFGKYVEEFGLMAGLMVEKGNMSILDFIEESFQFWESKQWFMHIALQEEFESLIEDIHRFYEILYASCKGEPGAAMLDRFISDPIGALHGVEQKDLCRIFRMESFGSNVSFNVFLKMLVATKLHESNSQYPHRSDSPTLRFEWNTSHKARTIVVDGIEKAVRNYQNFDESTFENDTSFFGPRLMMLVALRNLYRIITSDRSSISPIIFSVTVSRGIFQLWIKQLDPAFAEALYTPKSVKNEEARASRKRLKTQALEAIHASSHLFTPHESEQQTHESSLTGNMLIPDEDTGFIDSSIPVKAEEKSSVLTDEDRAEIDAIRNLLT